MALTILDPTNEAVPLERKITPRPEVIKGKVAFLDISKPRGSVLLDRLQEAFEQRLPQVEITRYTKPTFSKPAPDACEAAWAHKRCTMVISKNCRMSWLAQGSEPNLQVCSPKGSPGQDQQSACSGDQPTSSKVFSVANKGPAEKAQRVLQCWLTFS